MQFPERVSRDLSNLLMVAACVGITLMMLHVVADVAGKFFFNFPVEGTVETVEIYYMVMVVFLPFAYVTRTTGQIEVELFTRNLRGRKLAVLEVALGVIILVYMLLMTWKTGEDAIDKTGLGEIREAGVSFLLAWPSRWFPPLGSGVMALTVLVRLIADIRVLATGEAVGRNGADAY